MPGGRHVAGQSRVRMVKAGSHFASVPVASSATPDPKAAADAFEPAWTPRPVGARFATSPKAEQPSATQVAAQIAPKPVTLPTRPSTSASSPSAWETAEFMRIAAARGTSGASSSGAVTANAASATRAMRPIASPTAAPATVSRAAKQPALRTTASASSARAASQSPQVKPPASAPAEPPAFDPFAYHPEIAARRAFRGSRHRVGSPWRRSCYCSNSGTETAGFSKSNDIPEGSCPCGCRFHASLFHKAAAPGPCRRFCAASHSGAWSQRWSR